jgi:hypothetical protein
MKTAKIIVLPLLLVAAALGMLLISVPFGFCAISVGGIFAIVYGDYGRQFKPIRVPLATIEAMPAATDFRLAA